MGFCSDYPLNVRTKFDVRSFTIPEITGVLKKIAQSLDMLAHPFLQIFNGLLFRRTL